MSEIVKLKAKDGHELDAYVARPAGEPIGGLVVVQEIFGVNHHIRSVADGFAKDGFLAVAPAMFDRFQRDVELGYSGEDWQIAMGYAQKINIDDAVLDVSAALDYVKKETGTKSGVVGYCFGGSMAWLAAARLDPDVAVGYYGGYIPKFNYENPRVPVMLHFGAKDEHIPLEGIEQVKAAHPEVEVYLYDAGHGFNCDERASYSAMSSKIARERTVTFLKQHMK